MLQAQPRLRMAQQREISVKPAAPPVVRSFRDCRVGPSEKAEVGSIRRRPVGGGLGVYEPVPDRTVSGNAANFGAQWGVSADKKWQK